MQTSLLLSATAFCPQRRLYQLPIQRQLTPSSIKVRECTSRYEKKTSRINSCKQWLPTRRDTLNFHAHSKTSDHDITKIPILFESFFSYFACSRWTIPEKPTILTWHIMVKDLRILRTFAARQTCTAVRQISVHVGKAFSFPSSVDDSSAPCNEQSSFAT